MQVTIDTSVRAWHASMNAESHKADVREATSVPLMSRKSSEEAHFPPPRETQRMQPLSLSSARMLINNCRSSQAARDEIVKRNVTAAQQGVKGELDGDVTGYRKRISPTSPARIGGRDRQQQLPSRVTCGKDIRERKGDSQQISLQARKLTQWPWEEGLHRGQKADGGRQCWWCVDHDVPTAPS